MNIIKKQTPHFTKGGNKKNVVSIHIMDGTLIGTTSWFAAPKSKVSAHYAVGAKGEIYKYVDENDVAWAQGMVRSPSSKIVLSRPGVNPNSYCISIDCEGKDLAKVPDLEIKTLVSLIQDICTRNNIPMDREHILGHYEINSVTRSHCPSGDRSIMDKIVSMLAPDIMVNISVKKSQLERINQFIKSL